MKGEERFFLLTGEVIIYISLDANLKHQGPVSSVLNAAPPGCPSVPSVAPLVLLRQLYAREKNIKKKKTMRKEESIP